MNAIVESIEARIDDSQWTVMTRSVRVIVWNLPRTKVFSLSNPALSGILWWRDVDAVELKELHERVRDFCIDSGGACFCNWCHDYSMSGKAFWKAFLDDKYKRLRWRT